MPKLETVEDVLEHFGVKGMKWGVRKNRSGSASEDAQRADAARKKIKTEGGTKALSNKELQDLVTRMNLEQQYSTLTGKQKKSTLNKGQETAKSILGVGKTVNEAIVFVNSPAMKLLKEQLAAGKKK
jgi:hypothetical protein